MKKSNSLIKSLLSSGGKDILSDIGEITLEAVAKSEIIDKIPVVNWLRSCYSIGHSISDSYFVYKLLKFLKEFHSISEAEKNELRVKMIKDAKFESEVGDKLIQILIHMDDAEKAKIIARLFLAYVDSKISYDDFCRFSQVVNNTFLKDILRIRDSERVIDEDDGLVKISSEDAMLFLNSGLVEISSESTSEALRRVGGALGTRNIMKYYLNNSGIEFFEII